MAMIAVDPTIDGLEDLTLKLDVDSLATLMSQYVINGSQKNVLSITDLTIVLPPGKSVGDDATVKELFDAGSDLFSAIIYQKLTNEQRARVPNTPPDLTLTSRDLTAERVSLLFFVDFFYIFTQARHPTKEMDGMGRPGREYKPAQFILNTIGASVSFEEIEAQLFVKGLAKIPMEWVKKVPLNQLSTEAQNRFLLGAAGHRIMQAFTTIRPLDDAPADVKKIWAELIEYTQSGYSWNFHTAFRTVNFVRLFKSLNKILEHMLMTYGRPDDIEAAVSDTTKVLYRPPQADARYRDYSALLRPEFKNFMATDKMFTL